MSMAAAPTARWQFWIDRGGTFTDCVGVGPGTGQIHITKVRSSDQAPIAGIRALLRIDDAAPLPPCDVRLGTTVATNALLERNGAAVGLLVTQGFEDVLLIGTQARPELFELDIQKPKPLYSAVEGVRERLDARGDVLRALDEAHVLEILKRWRGAGLSSIAVCLLHSVKSSEHELRIGDLARNLGFDHVALSHEVANEVGFLARCDTCVLDATLTPLCRAHLRNLRAALSQDSSLLVMQSSGGLTTPEQLRGPRAVLSGPAAGVVALSRLAKSAQLGPCLGFDMGGTSTDVSRYAGDLETDFETEVAGIAIRAPMLRIETVAAGGGSLCWIDAGRLRVGPQSAGATPGPLCYGAPEATALTVTDVNLLLGRLVPDRFPLPLNTARAESWLTQALPSLPNAGSIHDLAEGFFHVANANMAEAVRRVSALRGHDPRDHSLVVFGGSGGQHACALARRLGIKRVVFHPWAGVLSAYGLGLAELSAHAGSDATGTLWTREAPSTLEPSFRELEAKADAELRAATGSEATPTCVRSLDLRYAGSDHSLCLPLKPTSDLAQRFHQAHSQAFGFAQPDCAIEVVTLRVRGSSDPTSATVDIRADPTVAPTPPRTTRLFYEGKWLSDVPVYFRETLARGRTLDGPAIIAEATSTLVLDPGFRLEVRADGLLEAKDTAKRAAPPELRRRSTTDRPDPVLLEIFGNAFMSIAEQMGESLRRTARSTNIVERRDFSCAVFDPEGNLVANAPHIPVHLGAMSETVRAVLRLHPTIRATDAFISNDPSLGGSHLPDITVVSPVCAADGELLFFTASRGHHADVGGISPGSMPAVSTSLEQEGVVFRGMRGVRDGRLDEAALRRALEAGPYPARAPNTNIADLKAQLAANVRGACLLTELTNAYGVAVVASYMQHVRDDAARQVQRAILELAPGQHDFSDCLDDGTRICVRVTVRGKRMCIDFAGTAPAHAGNFNAPRAVTTAAVIYFLRALVGRRIPLNEGCLEPVEIRIPSGSLLDPPAGAAVAAGNVETSQRIVDVLFGAVGKCAASQGTMNNLTLGNANFAYYETIAGGAGAGADFDGACAVHTHMTNTRITDAEVLESRYPLRLWRFCIRRGSGGDGLHPGGDGLVRELELLEDMQGALIAGRRTTQPFGLAGGNPGVSGSGSIDGKVLSGTATFTASAGSRLCIETPGGGGYGVAPRGGRSRSGEPIDAATNWRPGDSDRKTE